MRILMLAPEPFLEPRGTPFSIYHRIKALLALGYEVDLVTYPIGKQVEMAGLRIYRAPALPFLKKVEIGPSLAKFPLDLCLFLTAVWQLNQEHYHYLHTHEEAGAMGVILAFIFRCRHLFDMHSDLSLMVSHFSLFKHPLLIHCVAAIQQSVLRHADIVIAVTAELKQTAEKIVPGKPIYLIRNVAVDEDMPAASQEDAIRLRQQLQLGSAPILLYTGTLEHYQGIDLLLQSAALVHQQVPSAHYVLVGGHPHQVSTYRHLAQELGIADIVHFTGQRPPEEMPQYMVLADILLSPRREGTNTPLKLYTYLRSGKPILATETYSHTELLTHDTSQLVPPTPEGLAQGALELLRDAEKAHRLGANGKKLAEEQYSWPVFLEKNRQAYNVFTGPIEPGEPGEPQKSPHLPERSRVLAARRHLVYSRQRDLENTGWNSCLGDSWWQ